MAIFNVNQNRQFYVAKEVVSTTPKKEGDIQLGKTSDGKQIWFKHFGKGGLTRTDLIDVDKICYTKVTTKKAMQRKPKKATVTLNPTYLSDGKPISGQDYILRIQVNNYLAPGDACVLIRSAAVHAVKDMTAAQFYEKMVKSLEMNFSRDAQPLLKFETSKTSDGGHEANGIIIKEVANQPWRLGVLSQEPVNFEVYPTTVRYDGEEVNWANLNDKGFIDVVEDTDADPIGNGRQVADLEYFCMAERGDMFRNMGWPNNIDVKYMVEPDKEYDMLDLHYYFSGDGVQVHKSEKDLTIVTATDSVMTAIKEALIGLGIEVKE